MLKSSLKRKIKETARKRLKIFLLRNFFLHEQRFSAEATTCKEDAISKNLLDDLPNFSFY